MTTVWTAAGLPLTGLMIGIGGAAGPERSPTEESARPAGWGLVPVVCSAVTEPAAATAPLEPPEYYGFELVPTGTVPGTGLAEGEALVHFPDNPFGIAIAADGSYVYQVGVRVERLNVASGVPTVWFAKSDLSEIERAGVIGEDGTFTGQVSWNKFLAIVTLEPTDDPAATGWKGPILMRGMSRSGMMHTMAGHGPFQTENCAQYGYR